MRGCTSTQTKHRNSNHVQLMRMLQMSLLTHSLFVCRSAFADSSFLPLNIMAIYLLLFPLLLSFPHLAFPKKLSLLATKAFSSKNKRWSHDKTKYPLTETCLKSFEFERRFKDVNCDALFVYGYKTTVLVLKGIIIILITKQKQIWPKKHYFAWTVLVEWQFKILGRWPLTPGYMNKIWFTPMGSNKGRDEQKRRKSLVLKDWGYTPLIESLV